MEHDQDRPESAQVELRAEVVTLTREELRGIVTEAIQEAFQQIGLDSHDPLEVQRDMAHLRKWREAVDAAGSASFKTVVTTLILGGLGLLWVGFQQAMK